MIRDKILGILLTMPHTPDGEDILDVADKLEEFIVQTYGPPF